MMIGLVGIDVGWSDLRGCLYRKTGCKISRYALTCDAVGTHYTVWGNGRG